MWLAAGRYGPPSPSSGYSRLLTHPEPDLYTLIPGVKTHHSRDGLPIYYVPPNVPRLTPTVPRRLVTPSGLELRPYQREAFALVAAAPKGSYVALDTGLGKTLVVCQYLAGRRDLRPFLVVGPLSAAGTWVGEQADPQRHYGMRVALLESRSPSSDKMPAGADGYFVNPAILSAWRSWILGRVQPKVIVLDEADEFREGLTKQGQTLSDLVRYRTVERRIALSATPVVRRTFDLYAQLHLVQPWCWGWPSQFGVRYAAGWEDEYGWHFPGTANVAELRWRLANVMYRRTRAEVVDDLPPLTRDRVTLLPNVLDPTAFARYTVAATGDYSHASAGSLLQYGQMAEALSEAKRACVVEEALRFLRELRETRKLVIFTWYQATAEYIYRALSVSGRVAVFGPVLGTTPHAQRLKMADKFRAARVAGDALGAVFVATMGCAGRAMNALSCAQGALFADLYYVPAKLLQAEGRIHRWGQTASRVICRYLYVPGTMDELMWSYLQVKADAIVATTGDAKASDLVASLGQAEGDADAAQQLFDDMMSLRPEDLD